MPSVTPLCPSDENKEREVSETDNGKMEARWEGERGNEGRREEGRVSRMVYFSVGTKNEREEIFGEQAGKRREDRGGQTKKLGPQPGREERGKEGE